jgi:hypothetical protein
MNDAHFISSTLTPQVSTSHHHRRYSIAQLLSLSHHNRICRSGRRVLFTYHLWQPAPSSTELLPAVLINYHRSSSISNVSVSVLTAAFNLLHNGLNLLIVTTAALCVCASTILLVRDIAHTHISSTVGNPGIPHTVSEENMSQISRTHITPRVGNPSKPLTISEEKASLHPPQNNTNGTSLNVINCVQKKNMIARMLLTNARSICNKVELITEALHVNNIDIMAVTETWLKGNEIFDNSVLNMICGDDYKSVSAPRKSSKKGGGVAIFVRKSVRWSKLQLSCHLNSFEFLCCSLSFSTQQQVVIGVIYRPPQTSLSDFFSELDILLQLLSHHDRLILVGDFNINVSSGSPHATKLLNVMNDFDLLQHVDTATHESGNILDLVFARNKFCSISHISVIEGFSDHACILFGLVTPDFKSSNSPTVQTRSLKNVNFDYLTQDFFDFLTLPILWALQTFQPSIEDLIGFYNDASTKVFDSHAPIISRRISTRPRWVNSSLLESRRKLRRAERQWRATKLPQHRQYYQKARKEHNRVIICEKKKSIKSFIAKCGTNSKLWWKQLNEVCGRVNPPVLPQGVPHSKLAQKFLTFFIDKVNQVRLSTSSTTISSNETPPSPSAHNLILSRFELASQKEVKKTIMSISDSTCELDPVPTRVVKKCLPAFLPLITALVNKIFEDGLPPSLKMSVIRPLYKKGNLDPENLSSYRPVANIPFLSKVVEKLVARRIVCHMDLLENMNPNQHAYRKMHSCETALLTMLNEAFLAVDNGMVLPLVLLDLTAAFDVVDHELLLIKCQKFGIHDSANEWLRCYLSGRKQRVSCSGHQSELTELPCGVPQGSVLGPLLFSIFISEISTVIDRHGMHHVIYADDMQIYTRSSTADIPNTIHAIEACLADVHQSLCSQKLVLNPRKSEFIVFASKNKLSATSNLSIRLCDHEILRSNVVRNLGVMLDTNLTFHSHVNKIRQQAFMYLRVISKARRYLSKQHSAQLVDSLAVSRINFCVSVLVGVSKDQILRLQSIINYGIRIVEKLKKRENVTSHLRQRGWLSVDARIQYRISQIVFMALMHGSPKKLASLLELQTTSHSLRSETNRNLVVPRTSTRMGDRAFAVAGPKLFNAIPPDVRQMKTQFKSKLKTLLL